mmetsp:Transcript_39717/g.38277  ORF Transcript_39717/g.38277 Transcript_39717/m.38277 type:complete len:157 (-) Transcript_39717:194-664(-)
MSIAWGIFGILQISTVRYMKHLFEFTYYMHLVQGILIMLITIVFGVMGIKKVHFQMNTRVHHILGLAVLVAVVIICVEGMYAWNRSRVSKWNTRFILSVKKFHKIFGYFFIFLAQASICTGQLIHSYNIGTDALSVIGYIHLGGWFLIYLTMELVY